MSFEPAGSTVYVDGEYVDGADARISIWDHARPSTTSTRFSTRSASERGIRVEERDVWPLVLYAADAMFATGSGAGIVPIAEVDGVRLATGGNQVVATVQDAYRAATRDPRYAVPVTA